MFCRWDKASEISDLSTFNIGVMPLDETHWAKGKCGFKALQYMALEIAPIISPIGVNSDIVTHGKDGFLCTTSDEWKTHLIKLIESQSLRNELGKNAYVKIKSCYSVNANYPNYKKLLNV